jgi:hypothetical protein
MGRMYEEGRLRISIFISAWPQDFKVYWLANFQVLLMFNIILDSHLKVFLLKLRYSKNLDKYKAYVDNVQ